LLSIIINFLYEVDRKIENAVNEKDNPRDKLKMVIDVLEDVFSGSVYVSKISNESLPDFKQIKEEKLRDKRNKITDLNIRLNTIIDTIILDGQNSGVFYRTNNPSLIRQILLGAFEKMVLNTMENGNVSESYILDVQKTIDRLFNKFICSQ